MQIFVGFFCVRGMITALLLSQLITFLIHTPSASPGGNGSRGFAGLPEALLYVRHITSPDAFPCTVVEKDNIIAINTVNLVAACVHSIPI